ncbi:MAG: hypothetical protein ACRCUY_02650 [Thermoguttaceae bacterium]
MNNSVNDFVLSSLYKIKELLFVEFFIDAENKAHQCRISGKTHPESSMRSFPNAGIAASP